MTKARDRDLGMNREITRRDILHGVGGFAAASIIPGTAMAGASLLASAKIPPTYPPALTGLRGSHVGSFEIAHELAREGRRDWGKVEDIDSDVYDLVGVGAGLQGGGATCGGRGGE